MSKAREGEGRGEEEGRRKGGEERGSVLRDWWPWHRT